MFSSRSESVARNGTIQPLTVSAGRCTDRRELCSGGAAVIKVIVEDLCRSFHETAGTPIALLRYRAFVPGSYLEYGTRLLRNGIDRHNVAISVSFLDFLRDPQTRDA